MEEENMVYQRVEHREYFLDEKQYILTHDPGGLPVF